MDKVEAQELIQVVNGLSADAAYLATLPFFTQVLAGKPVLALAETQRQKKAFAELLEAGFVHGDVERGTYGFRSTMRGRAAAIYCKASFLQGEPA